MMKIDEILDKVLQVMIKVIIIILITLTAYHLRKDYKIQKAKYIVKKITKNGHNKETSNPFF